MKFQTRSRRKKRGDTAQLAAQLAPLEEVDKSSAAKQGVVDRMDDPEDDPHFASIVVDNEGLHVPVDIMEGGNEKTYMGMEPVVLVILGVMLVFIAFIAWQISLMPVE